MFGILGGIAVALFSSYREHRWRQCMVCGGTGDTMWTCFFTYGAVVFFAVFGFVVQLAVAADIAH